ncbi:MAG: hypothetical protein FJX54_08220 [Alphaproteobacteria bacterium]|nr:hypothetical protein [Alphaproteobacteria bacterium]
MTKERFISALRRRGVALAAAAAVIAGTIAPATTARSDEPMTTEEVVQELTELTAKITPFTVTYDKDGKWLVFREEVESSNKSAPVQIGELRARLDRMDRTRMRFAPGAGGIRIQIKGKTLAGQAHFFCREGMKCIARELRGEQVAASFVDGAELSFGIDIYEGSLTTEVRRFADLIGHLIVVSTPK